MVQTFNELLAAIGQSAPNADYMQGDVVRIQIWRGRTVVGTPYECREVEVDISVETTTFPDVEPLRHFLGELLSDGAMFVTKTGNVANPTTLQWSIEDPTYPT